MSVPGNTVRIYDANKVAEYVTEFPHRSEASAGGAPADATYIVQTPNSTLTSEQALSVLATGLLKNTTATGVLSIAVEGTDYYKPGGTDVAVADGGTGASTAAGARTNLGLGTIATQDANNVAITGGAITGMSSPSVASDVATKGYVDALSAGLKWKTSVVVATTAAGTLASSFENGDTVDGVTLTTGDRILIKNQVSGAENGIYVVAASGAPTRATDADSGSELVSAAVFVEQGTTNADKAFVCTNNSITIGVTSIVFTAFATVIGALIAANNLSDLASASTARTNLGLVIGTDVEAHDADLTAIAALTPSDDDFIQRKTGAWVNRTPTQVTADLITIVGDSGSGGTKGLVPAPAAGDAAAAKFLKADGTWAAPSGSGGLTQAQVLALVSLRG